MSSVTSTYGANIAFIEELYEKYRSDPNSVSTSWREFFHDYQPEEEGGEQPPPAVPAPTRTAEAAVLHAVPPPPTTPNAVPLRGAAGKIAQNMEAPRPPLSGRGRPLPHRLRFPRGLFPYQAPFLFEAQQARSLRTWRRRYRCRLRPPCARFQ